MKLTKTVKYNYTLTEETLEKDIDNFIKSAKNGDYQWDRQYNSEGLKIIKQYLKILKEKFKNNELEECKNCYHKLIPFLLMTSSGDTDLFDYEDLLAKISSNFDSYIKNYFICLIGTCKIDEIADKVSEYAASLDMYGFDSDIELLLSLGKEKLQLLEEKMLAKTECMTKKDKNKQDILYFLLGLAQEQKDKEKYLRLCEGFKGVLNKEEFEYLQKEYEEDIAWAKNEQ